MHLSRLLSLVPGLIPLCLAIPEPHPKALPDPAPNAEAEAQSYVNNAPFSGAVYIVDLNGQQITTPNTNMCPNTASVSCGDISKWGWCCPSGTTCAAPASGNGLIGCCPSGNNCGGSVNAAAVTTVTITLQQNQHTTVYVQPTQQVPTTTAFVGYCSTLTMNGPGLPTTTQGSCGTILIVNEGAQHINTIGYSRGGMLLFLHLALGRMFHWR